MKLEIESNKELWEKWNKVSKYVQSIGIYIKTHIAPIVQNDIDIELKELKELRDQCESVTEKLEKTKNLIKILYNETILYIKTSNNLNKP